MKDYTISSFDGKTIQFSGDLIGSVENVVEFRDGHERKFCLKTYSTSPGYVVQIEYVSEGEGEKVGSIFEKVDSLNDVQNFFFVFESAEVLRDEKGLSRDELGERTRLGNKLNAVYEKLTYEMLDLFESYIEEHNETDEQIRADQ